MKTFILSILSLLIGVAAFATQVTISTSGFTFSPPDVPINFGDTIVFNVGGGHTATEVSQSTWNGNGTTASGAFDLGSGSDQQVVGLSVGVHYYVCQNHVGSMGMKGKITVNAVAGVKDKSTENNLLKLFPNPSKDYLFFELPGTELKKITITSVDGKISKETIPTKNTNKISIADLPAGEYIFSVYSKKDELFIKKFVKE